LYSTITYTEFVDTYKPILNKITKYPSDTQIAFETFGEELDFVRSHDEKAIWTEVDGDGGVYIISGFHYVNRIQYYVCEVPNALPIYQEAVVELSRECECNYEGEGKPDCQECEGSGYISIYPDTREELIEIYGEDYANEQI
jgi:hypothetical protein